MLLSATVIVYLILLAKSNADIEDHDASPNIVDLPVSVNFHEIFGSHLAMLADDKAPSQPRDEKDKDFHLDGTQFVEFRFPKIETSTMVFTTTPPPRYAIGAAYLKNNNQSEETTTSATTNNTTESSEVPNTSQTTEIPIKVPPKKNKCNQQRGVLDLLFPAYRVKAFKNVFDSLRMVLSHTFRRR